MIGDMMKIWADQGVKNRGEKRKRREEGRQGGEGKGEREAKW